MYLFIPNQGYFHSFMCRFGIILMGMGYEFHYRTGFLVITLLDYFYNYSFVELFWVQKCRAYGLRLVLIWLLILLSHLNGWNSPYLRAYL